MKNFISFLIIFLVFFIGGCTWEDKQDGTFRFYYPRQEIICGSADGVIGWEQQKNNLREAQIDELIRIYMDGPSNPGLYSPLSDNITLLEHRADNTGLHITFSTNLAEMPPATLALSLSALSKTLFQVIDLDIICIHADATLLDGEQKIVFTRDSIYLWDTYTDKVPTETTTEIKDDIK